MSALRPSHLRRATPLVIAGPLLAALVLAGQGTWGLGDDGDPGDTVRALVADGPLGVDSSERGSPELTGAHPVTDLNGDLDVQQAVARDGGNSAPAGTGPDVSDLAVPARVLAAYRDASSAIRRSDSECHLTWPLLAGIGKVESGHALGGAVDRTGLTLRPILGPVLDGGPGVAAITDSDDGRWDTDTTWDRAVGPMQFIPTSWRLYGADGNGDGRDDPNNVADAALASGGYLCSGERDLDVERHRRAAVFSYNHSWDYVDLVLAWADAYEGGTPVLTGDLPVLASSARTGRPPACPECSDSRRTPSNPRVASTPTATPVAATASPPSPSPGTAASEETVQLPADPADPTEPVVSAPAQTPPPDDAVAPPTPSPSPCPTASESPAPTASPSPTASPEPDATPTALPSDSPSPTETGPTPSPTPTPSESCGSGSTA